MEATVMYREVSSRLALSVSMQSEKGVYIFSCSVDRNGHIQSKWCMI